MLQDMVSYYLFICLSVNLDSTASSLSIIKVKLHKMIFLVLEKLFIAFIIHSVV